MENNLLENTYENKNLLTRTYFKQKVEAAIRLAKLKKDDIILDFGCGAGWLEERLRKFYIVGYDINPEKTFIKDLIEAIGKESDPEKIQYNVFELIKSNGLKVSEGFKLIYNIILNSDRGPRLGQYIVEVGKEEIIKKLKDAL